MKPIKRLAIDLGGVLLTGLLLSCVISRPLVKTAREFLFVAVIFVNLIECAARQWANHRPRP